MASLSAIKPFLPFLLTFFIPRGIAYYRAIKVAIKTRPQPRPLSAKTSRGLNILFLSICLFLFMSLPSYSRSYQANIFDVTKSKLHIPTDMLFDRLALIRPLTPSDEALREKITTPSTRQLYLRFGPTTLLTCPFCHPTSPNTYLLHHLPTHTLLPHLLHFLLLGLATSSPISPASSTFRTKFSLSALGLAVLDIYLTSTLTPTSPLFPTTSPSPPWGLYWTITTLRPLTIALVDLLFAATLYLAATNRLPFLLPTPTPTPEARRRQQINLLTQSSIALQTSLAKLRAFSVARSAVVRDGEAGGLKARDDEYWRVVVAMEGAGEGGGGTVWEEEEVMEAMARVTKGGGVDVERVRREAVGFVESVTRGLEMEMEMGDDGEEGLTT